MNSKSHAYIPEFPYSAMAILFIFTFHVIHVICCRFSQIERISIPVKCVRCQWAFLSDFIKRVMKEQGISMKFKIHSTQSSTQRMRVKKLLYIHIHILFAICDHVPFARKLSTYVNRFKCIWAMNLLIVICENSIPAIYGIN